MISKNDEYYLSDIIFELKKMYKYNFFIMKDEFFIILHDYSLIAPQTMDFIDLVLLGQ